MSEWQPIESAPQDGRQVLLFGTQNEFADIAMKGAFVFTGYWDRFDESWCSTATTWRGPFYHPTHWQPLPEPPKEQSA